MTRLICPGCGFGASAAAAGQRTHECARCGTSFTLAADDQGFAVLVGHDRRAVRVVVRGEVDLVTAPMLHRHLAGVSGDGVDLVEVDLSGVTFMDVRGVNVLLGAQAAIDAAGGTLSLRDPSEAVRRTLRLCGVDEALSSVV